MEILGIGPAELAFIIVIALIVLGPKDMQKAGRTFGKWLRKVVTSDGWKLFQQTSREIQQLPTRLMREAGLEELQKDLKQPLNTTQVTRLPSQPASNGTPKPDSVSEPANTILPSPPPPSADEGETKE